MAASYIKILKSYAFLEEPIKAYEWLFLFHDHFLCLDNLYMQLVT